MNLRNTCYRITKKTEANKTHGNFSEITQEEMTSLFIIILKYKKYQAKNKVLKKGIIKNTKGNFSDFDGEKMIQKICFIHF